MNHYLCLRIEDLYQTFSTKGLTTSLLKTLTTLLQVYDKADIQMDKAMKQRLSTLCAIEPTTLQHHLRALEKRGYLEKTNRSTYRLNPDTALIQTTLETKPPPGNPCHHRACDNPAAETKDFCGIVCYWKEKKLEEIDRWGMPRKRLDAYLENVYARSGGIKRILEPFTINVEVVTEVIRMRLAKVPYKAIHYLCNLTKHQMDRIIKKWKGGYYDQLVLDNKYFKLEDHLKTLAHQRPGYIYNPETAQVEISGEFAIMIGHKKEEEELSRKPWLYYEAPPYDPAAYKKRLEAVLDEFPDRAYDLIEATEIINRKRAYAREKMVPNPRTL